MNEKDVAFASIRQLADLIKRKKISPVELTKIYLERLKKYGEKLGAVVTITEELALRQARQAEREIMAGKYRGLLHGIPFGVKDLLATKGIPTTWGAEPYRNQIFDYNATVVEKLYNAGAILVAKLAMVELAGGMGYDDADASFTGPGRTPWNLNYWSGGSSSGSGAAVAAGLVAFAIGSETSGSILTPSAFCGITGLRPTYGLVSRFGAMALSWTLDKLGPMCRSADDCGIVLSAIAGYDPKDETTIKFSFEYNRKTLPRKKPKIAVIKGTTEKAQPEVRKNFEDSLRVLAEFAELEYEVEFPDHPWGAVVSAIVDAEGASAFYDLILSGEISKLRNKRDKVGGYSMIQVTAVEYLNAMRLRKKMRKALEEFLSRYDAIVAPTRASVAYPIGVDFDKAYPGVGGGPALIPAGNLAGVPAICMPNGFGQNNLPTSIQFMGKALSEKTLIQIANAYQSRTDWHLKRPPIDD
ncbi:Asp-tRNAAsn/Glu-tRNAGln amidotransferase A subunit [Candidatus Thermokryptus mobilis]|uniref:Asp-tRNAAsn/Glu-tRNAGln amidotransferase A subunit n=1 Tax=Candidatus Thermokryptus mobilis TaxID=1643428 RepID=A0A0S4MWL5_9BACT|nr:amidase [Candidatus Thermokryptus mobilis]CUU03356.1 Asp-tRNAAsn/Glu-tRNAGln amidotransferase A subunit [Candidatus Thermokryptus mobilis]